MSFSHLHRVIPAKAGIQTKKSISYLDPRLCGDDTVEHRDDTVERREDERRYKNDTYSHDARSGDTPLKNAPLIYLVAGEASGDILGSRLMRALKHLCPGVRFAGVGGPLMTQEGLISLFPMTEISLMGLVEIIPHIPHIFKRLKQTQEHVLTLKPDVVVTIDSPGFTFRLAKRLKGHVKSLVHYTAPTVWAWKPKRAAKIAKIYNHLLALFPFEPLISSGKISPAPLWDTP